MLLTMPPAGFSLMFPLSSCTCMGRGGGGGDIYPNVSQTSGKIIFEAYIVHAVFQQHRTQILLLVFVLSANYWKLLPGSSLVPMPRGKPGYEASQACNSSSTYSTFAIFSRRIILTLGGKSTAQEI